MQAVIIGVGRIGRGFAGERLGAAGHDLVLVGAPRLAGRAGGRPWSAVAAAEVSEDEPGKSA
jgi:hypothetical protein